MKTIIVQQDNIHCIESQDFSAASVYIVSKSFSKLTSDLFLLTNTGHLLNFSVANGSLLFRCSWLLNSEKEDWFDVTFIDKINAVVCISKCGYISYIELNSSNLRTIQSQSICDGIAIGGWTPDRSHLLILTSNNVLKLVSTEWQTIMEVSFCANATVPFNTELTWRRDGEVLAFMYLESHHNNSRIRLYTLNNLQLSVSCDVASNDELLLSSSHGVISSFASHGSLLALCSKRTKDNAPHKVALVMYTEDFKFLPYENFDLTFPTVPAGYDEWEVRNMEWHVTPVLIAICLKAVSKDVRQELSRTPGVVQLYLRYNDCWNLKQQWEGDSLSFLGFDTEVVNRMYMSQLVVSQSTGKHTPAARIVDIVLGDNVLDKLFVSSTAANGLKLPLNPLSKDNESVKKPVDDEKSRRRERNKIDARNTRCRKRQQLEEMEQRIKDLSAEKTNLQSISNKNTSSTHKGVVLPDADVASILMSLASMREGTSSTIPSPTTIASPSKVVPQQQQQHYQSHSHKGSTVGIVSLTSMVEQYRQRGSGSLQDLTSVLSEDMMHGDHDNEGEEEEEEVDDAQPSVVNSDEHDASQQTVQEAASLILLGHGGVVEDAGDKLPANKKLKSEYTSMDSESRRKERNRIHAQKARLRKKKLMVELHAIIANLEYDIVSLKQQQQEQDDPAVVISNPNQ